MKTASLLLAVLATAVLPVLACGDDDIDAAGGDDGVDASTSSSGAASSSGGGGGSSSGNGGGSSSGGSSGGGSSSGDGGTCARAPRADDATRFIAASRPYDADANDVGTLTMFSLASDGAITQLANVELAGSQSYGNLAMSPDGRLGAIAYDAAIDGDDVGKVGIFAIDDAGVATVVNARYQSGFTGAESVRFSPDGEWLYVVDGNTPANGGGLYAAKVGCDGTVGDATRVTESRGSTVPFWFTQDPTRAAAVGDTFAGAPSAADGLHVLSISGSTVTRLGSGNVFGASTAIRLGAVSNDDRVGLFTAWNPLLGGPRVIAARFDGAQPSLLTAYGPAEGLLGSGQVVLASPYGNAFFLTSATADRAYRVLYTPDATDAGSVLGPLEVLTTIGKAPELSSTGAVIGRGALRGRIVLGEVVALRELQFQADGTITNVSITEMPGGADDLSASVGAIGVTP